MGYVTKYCLEVVNKKATPQLIGFIDSKDFLMEYFDGAWYGETKYPIEDDMREISEQFPDFLFKLEGQGEEIGDVWAKFYKNGKTEIAGEYITYECEL